MFATPSPPGKDFNMFLKCFVIDSPGKGCETAAEAAEVAVKIAKATK